MGLDMYAFATRRKPSTPVDFESSKSQDEEFHYWRKHPNLHGWMKRLYREKGGKDSDFNTANLELTSDDLAALEAAIKGKSLPETTGFLFGESTGTDDEAADDLEFVNEARKKIASGLTVYYLSWW